MPLDKKTAARNALLPMVLRRSCRDYPDMTALNRRLKELYGARLDYGISKRGEIQIISLSIKTLADEFTLNHESVLAQCASLLKSVLFDPLLENASFKSSEVEIERKNLADLIDSQLNDKRYYASMRLRKAMCAQEPFGVSELGTHEQALAVSPKDLYRAWVEMLTHSRAEIIYIGNGSVNKVKKLLADAFANVTRGKIVRCGTQVVKNVGDVKTIVERFPVTQAKLCLGFRAGVAEPEEDVTAMQLACTVLGGSAQSKLFLNVREKLGLCYYCYSRYERRKGLLFIESGIEEASYEKARDEILRQLDDLKNGDFTDNELRFAALSLANSYRELNDSLYEIDSWYLVRAISGKLVSPAQAARAILSVGREAVVRASQNIKLDTIYLLAGQKEAG